MAFVMPLGNYQPPDPVLPVPESHQRPAAESLPQAPVSHPRPISYYHMYLGTPRWITVAGEHFQALHDAEFWGEVHVGLIGNYAQRNAARMWLDDHWNGWNVACEYERGYEQPTLRALHDHARRVPANTSFFYAHTKGSWRVDPNSDLWRKCMQDHVISGWRNCVKLLEDYDTVGVHWITEDVLREAGFKMKGVGRHFGGNYWAASASYLSGLAPVGDSSRYEAEGWIGWDNPKYYDLAPGWINHPHEPKPDA